MKCPYCEKELPGITCPDCGQTVPEGANYCMYCGAPMREDLEAPVDQGPMEEDDLDLENRVLCPDGTCTGIIVDGRCTECGKSLEDHLESEVEAEDESADKAAEDKTEQNSAEK